MKPALILALALLSFSAGGSPPATEWNNNQAAAPAVSGTYQVVPVHPPSGNIEFKSVLDLKQNPTGIEPQLRHGIIAKSIEWPASLYATFKVPAGTATCTSALIGPQTVLTAAHCVPSNGIVTVTFSKRSYNLNCTQHPKYSTDKSADFALCKSDKPLAGPAVFLYETVDASDMGAMVGKTVVLTGYGCVSDFVALKGQSDGKYRIGANTINETSSSTTKLRDAQYYAGQEDNNLFTVDDPGLANLCPGDSGGPAFRLNPGSSSYTSRVIIGVNSRVFYEDDTQTSFGSSLIAASGGPDFRTWAEGWVAANGVAACGIAGNVPNCRN